VTQRCPNCDAVLPEGGAFCIDCGAAVPQATTGPTQRLPEHAGGPRCVTCGTRNPPGATFCVTCGRALADRPAADPPANPLPPAPAPIASMPAAPFTPAAPSRRRGPDAARWGGITGGLFLIGLAVIAAFNWWWPGILVLLGVTALSGSAASGKPWAGSIGAFFLIGLAVIAAFNWWWPGILVLLGVMAILGSALRPKF
jgi:hypothetical protein